MGMFAKAVQVAAQAHNGQMRRYTGDPYIVHPIAVAAKVEAWGDAYYRMYVTEEMLCAAVLHDTVEDTDLTIGDIAAVFGHKVRSIVDSLTDISRPEHGNRTTRKAADRAHVAAGGIQAQTIKLADLIDNGESIMAHDRQFAKVFVPEAWDSFKMFTEVPERVRLEVAGTILTWGSMLGIDLGEWQ